MFYDQSARSGEPLTLPRVAMAAASLLLLPPFIMLAIVPMLLFLLPVALVAIPVMIPAFFGGAHTTQIEVVRMRSWRPTVAVRV